MLKKVVIIGGNSGIGEVLKKQLTAEGIDTITASRSSEPSLDINDDSPSFPEVDGAIDALVYCPGTINLKPFRSLNIDAFRNDIEVNYLGAVKAIQHYLSNLKASEHPSIVLFCIVFSCFYLIPFHREIVFLFSSFDIHIVVW